jgi:hypothetical protein
LATDVELGADLEKLRGLILSRLNVSGQLELAATLEDNKARLIVGV